MSQGEIRLGIIGCGGFGLYALQQFAQVPGVKLIGMAGTHRQAAHAAARRFGIPDIEDVDKLLARDDVDLVYIATPPFLHYPQALAALEAGKHVICEKPLAMTVEQADAMIAAARKNDRLLVANLMQRYNPVYDAVDRLIQSQTLGDLLHGYFENYASDENLPPEHWFWDRSQKRGDLHRARRALLRPVRRLAGPGHRRGGRSAASAPARRRRSRSTSSARCATARRSWSTSITASIRPAGWTGRSCGWSSSGAT